MSHHVVETASTGEGQSFNFTKWIQENNLNDIKHLFIKHEMTTLDTLSMQSQQYQRFMSDPQFYSKHGNLIAPLINAMQNLPSLQTSSQSIIKVIISEEEQASIIDIENKLKTLDVMEQNIHSFNQTYPQSISKIQQEKLKQISAMKDKINQIFDGLYNKLKNKQTILLKSVEEIEQKVKNNDKGDDEKEMDVLSVARNELHNHRIYLQDKLKECDKLTSNNDKRQQRKQTILNMANDVSEKYESTKESIDDIMRNINGVIKQNESKRINIDFILNDVKYPDIIKNINNIGSIVNEVEVNNLPPFKWYRKQHGKGVEFVNDVTVKAGEFNAICVADHVVSSDEYFHYFEWEIQIDECGRGFIFFGLVHAPISKNITDWDTYLANKNSNNQYFVLINNYTPYKYFRIHDTGKETYNHQKETSNYTWKKGDRFKIRVDFNQRNASLYYNDKFIAIVFTNIADKIVPALSLNRGMQVSCTQWFAC